MSAETVRRKRSDQELAAQAARVRREEASAAIAIRVALSTCQSDHDRSSMLIRLAQATGDELAKVRDPVTAASCLAAHAGRLVPISATPARQDAEALFRKARPDAA